jgi:hypothetical protein
MLGFGASDATRSFGDSLRQVLLCGLVGMGEFLVLLLAVLFGSGLLAW